MGKYGQEEDGQEEEEMVPELFTTQDHTALERLSKEGYTLRQVVPFSEATSMTREELCTQIGGTQYLSTPMVIQTSIFVLERDGKSSLAKAWKEVKDLTNTLKHRDKEMTALNEQVEELKICGEQAKHNIERLGEMNNESSDQNVTLKKQTRLDDQLIEKARDYYGRKSWDEFLKTSPI